MASTTAAVNGTSEKTLSAADKLMHAHHNVEVEDTPDDEDLRHRPEPISSSILESTDETAQAPTWAPTMSAKAAGKQKEVAPGKENKPLDTQSPEAFPSLGGSAKPVFNQGWGKASAAPPAVTNGKANGVATNGSASPTSSLNTPPHSGPKRTPPFLSLQKNEVLPRNQLKKPLADICKDINKKLRTNLTVSSGENGVLEFRESNNVKEAVLNQAIRDLGMQIGAKSSAKIPIPRSAKAQLIGKQGSTIKGLQESTGARIQLPKTDDVKTPIDEDDDMVDVVVEGNHVAIQRAREAITQIANQHQATVNTKLRNIPAEFYPFIANRLEESPGVQVRVPPYYMWSSQPPPQRPLAGHTPAFLPAAGDNHISLAGDRASVQAARASIENMARELRQQLTVEALAIDKARHQYIIGNRGVTPEEFFAATNCAIVLPGPADEDMITIIGPADQLDGAINHANDLSESVRQQPLKLARKETGGSEHAQRLTQYLRDRKEIQRLEKLHNFHIATEEDTWNIFYREKQGTAALKAKGEILNIVAAHPPSRVTTLEANPFYNQYLRKTLASRVKQDFGVHLVVPEGLDSDNMPVILVFEGESGSEPEYQVPQVKPSREEEAAFKQGLADARSHIMELLSKQAEVISETVDVPHIFHDKLRKFIIKEQQDQQQAHPEQIPVRVINRGTIVTIMGPKPSVEEMKAKAELFIEQAKEDEKERGFTMSFDFPQKHANQLIGKGGSHIRELKDKFDVEINVKDGVVELKGPRAKAEAAKSHITSLGRQWADETTHILKVDPKFHRELIGAQGAQINKLQARYNVQIHFPRSARNVRDDQSTADAGSDAGRKPRREQEPDEVIIKGPSKEADKAKGEIKLLLDYLKEISHVASVTVQASQIPSLIGKNGTAMDAIRQDTKAKIDIPNARDAKDPSARVEIQIRGTKEQVAAAKKLIDQKRDEFDQTVTKTLEVDKKHHRALIGTGGNILKEIVVKSGGSDNSQFLARTVKFPKAEADGNAIKIEGKAEVVDKIIARMNQIVSERESQATETIDVPTDKHRSLIGRGGETKKELESKFKVSLDIPRQGNGQTGVKIVGLPADVEKAKLHILDLVKEQEGETIQVPRNLHHLVADNGQFFRRLRNDHQVTVDHTGTKVPPKPKAPAPETNGGALPLITDAADDAAKAHTWTVHKLIDTSIEGEIPWVLRGSPENIAKARAQLDAAIKQALAYTNIGYLGLPDPKTYRYVIGQGGSKVNTIRKATGCKITVPRDQAASERIEVVGTETGVEEARKLILKAVEDGLANSNRGPGSYGGGKGAIPGTGEGHW